MPARTEIAPICNLYKTPELKSREHRGMKWMDTDHDKTVQMSELLLALKVIIPATSCPLAEELST